MARNKIRRTGDEPKSQTVTGRGGTGQFTDKRPAALQLKALREGIADSPQHQDTVQLRKAMQDGSTRQESPGQRRSNEAGLPDTLKSGIENLSGYAMDDVKVHYNSSKPAQLQAHAYAQGTNIHLAPGQEKHLPHEAWHVVQQKQGRVKPTRQLKSKVSINDDAGLEKEADVMGARALQGEAVQRVALSEAGTKGQTVQMERYHDLVDQYDGGVGGDRVLVIEINLAGSGNQFLAPSDKERNATWKPNEDDHYLAHSTRPMDQNHRYYREQIEFEGPGGPNTTGLWSKAKGASDGGSNKISKLISRVPVYVEQLVENAPDQNWGKIVVLVTAHSRGAVAAYHVAHSLKYLNPEWHVELAQFDPVPGPKQPARYNEGYRPGTVLPIGPLATPLDDHTVVYSVASGWGRGFKPMLLHTMDRLIITQEPHSAGVGKTFMYHGTEYTRSELNKLPRGVYVETALGTDNQLILSSANSTAEAKKLYKLALASSRKESDFGRQAVIYKALNNFSWGD